MDVVGKDLGEGNVIDDLMLLEYFGLFSKCMPKSETNDDIASEGCSCNTVPFLMEFSDSLFINNHFSPPIRLR